MSTKARTYASSLCLDEYRTLAAETRDCANKLGVGDPFK